MRLGLWLPVVHRTPPYVAPDWERDGGGEDIAAVCAAAEACGYEFLCAPEHIALPMAKSHLRGEVYWDPVSTLGFVAARTRRIALVPLVFVMAYHHPLEIAKRMGTLDRLSGGRVIIGIGVGSLNEEFDLLGARFDERGARADDGLRALRAACGVRVPRYEGRFWRFDGMCVDPGLRADTQFWIGGKTPRSYRRAIEFGDAWAPVLMSEQEMFTVLRDPDLAALRARRERPLDVVVVTSGAAQVFDPLQRPDEARAYMRALAAAGVTALVPALRNDTRELYLAQIEAMAGLARELG
ncbi:MAG: TIGR03619 family F420-dependent LLM class oxidoreductase [Gammaproteobacteria bacterium]